MNEKVWSFHSMFDVKLLAPGTLFQQQSIPAIKYLRNQINMVKTHTGLGIG